MDTGSTVSIVTQKYQPNLRMETTIIFCNF